MSTKRQPDHGHPLVALSSTSNTDLNSGRTSQVLQGCLRFMQQIRTNRAEVKWRKVTTSAFTFQSVSVSPQVPVLPGRQPRASAT